MNESLGVCRLKTMPSVSYFPYTGDQRDHVWTTVQGSLGAQRVHTGPSTLSRSVPRCPWVGSEAHISSLYIHSHPLALFPHARGQEYLIKVGNLSRGAVQMIGDLLNTDSGYYEAFTETLRGIISFFQEPR